jgi:hypothetical protein
MTPEGAVKKEVMEYLALRGVFCWVNNTGRRGKVNFGKVGSSDIIGILDDGRFLAIELKAPGGVPTMDQIMFLAEIAKRGGVAFVATSAEEVADEFKRYNLRCRS